MALDHPTQKMSKSSPNPKSRIQLTDSTDEITRKIRTALTDSIEGVSYDPIARPGVSNLLELLHHVEGSSPSPAELARDFEGLSLKALKGRVATAVDQVLAPIRERYIEILSDGGRAVDEAAEDGARKATASAEATMLRVRETIGL